MVAPFFHPADVCGPVCLLVRFPKRKRTIVKRNASGFSECQGDLDGMREGNHGVAVAPRGNRRRFGRYGSTVISNHPFRLINSAAIALADPESSLPGGAYFQP